MRLATLGPEQRPHAIVVRKDGGVQVDGYADVGELLRGGVRALKAARAAQDSSEALAFDAHELLRPVLRPGAVVCVGLNYRSHILEMGRELPEFPTLFCKLPRALTDPYAEVTLPAASEQVDYEGELAVVIGTGGRDIDRARAWEHVAGLTVLNDVTARDYQQRTLQWFAGKTFQRCTPMGPWVVTPDEFGELGERELVVSVNGEKRQDAVLGDLVFDVPALVAELSRIVELEPGDVIATGTPGGVGEPAGKFLRPGDEVVVRIDGVGELRNTFRSSTR